MSNDSNPYKNSIETLSNGLLNNYQVPLEKIQNQLKELTLQQNTLIVQLHDENLSLAEAQHSPEVQELFKKMNLYSLKLVYIKKEMKLLHERSTKLKNRACRLRLIKEREEQEKLKNELKILKETELIGPGPASSSK